MRALVVAVPVDTLEHELCLVFRIRIREEHPITGGSEMGFEAGLADPQGFAAVCRDEVDAGFHRPLPREQVAARDLAVDDGLAVRREPGLDVVPRILGQKAGRHAVDRHESHAAEFLIVPGGEDDEPAVA